MRIAAALVALAIATLSCQSELQVAAEDKALADQRQAVVEVVLAAAVQDLRCPRESLSVAARLPSRYVGVFELRFIVDGCGWRAIYAEKCKDADTECTAMLASRTSLSLPASSASTSSVARDPGKTTVAPDAQPPATEATTCSACNGEIRPAPGRPSESYCLCRTHDRGKECRDGKECEGSCVWDHQSDQVIRTDPNGDVYGFRLGHCSEFVGRHASSCGPNIADDAAANGPYLLRPAHGHISFLPCISL